MDNEPNPPSYIEQAVDAPKLNIFPWPNRSLSKHAPAKPGSKLSNLNAAHYSRTAMAKGPRSKARLKKAHR